MSNKSKAYCRECKRETNHSIEAKHSVSGNDDENSISWWSDYEVLQCMGCETICFRRISSDTESIDYETGEPDKFVEIYPSTTKTKVPIQDSSEFPALTRRIYLETLTALTNNAPILAAIGIRAIIESICNNLSTGKGNLEKNIDALADLGHLSKTQADMLHKHRFMGNVAAHEIQPPKPSNLIAALEIAETLLKTIYVLPNLAATLDSPVKKPKDN